MSQFDTTATVISYTAYKAGRAERGQAPVIDCSGGEIIDGDGHPLSINTADTFFEGGPVTFDVRGEAVRAALMSLHEALIDDLASSMSEDGPRRSSKNLEVEVIAAHERGATFFFMRFRHAPAPL